MVTPYPDIQEAKPIKIIQSKRSPTSLDLGILADALAEIEAKDVRVAAVFMGGGVFKTLHEQKGSPQHFGQPELDTYGCGLTCIATLWGALIYDTDVQDKIILVGESPDGNLALDCVVHLQLRPCT